MPELGTPTSDLLTKYSIFFNIVPEYLLGNYLIKSTYLFVTEDSGSMITESILTNKPVYTVRPSKFKIEKLYDAFINKISVYLSGRIQINEIQNIDLKYVKNNNIKSPYEVFKLKLKKYLEEN